MCVCYSLRRRAVCVLLRCGSYLDGPGTCWDRGVLFMIWGVTHVRMLRCTAARRCVVQTTNLRPSSLHLGSQHSSGLSRAPLARLRRCSPWGMVPELIKRLALVFVAAVLRVHVWSLAKLMGYRAFEPERDTVLVTCCTNGLGHIHQMERVLGVLQEAGMRFPVIALAKEQKVPAYKMESLKAKFPEAQFVNLNFEIDYDNGKSFNNRQIVWSAAKTVTRRATPFYRRVTRLMKRHRPAYCLSFWEPGVASFINVMNCPTRLISVASQGQIYADDTGVERGLLMRALHQFNVGSKGTLVPLSVRPLEGAIPQVVRVPPLAPAAAEPAYFVAYSTVPQVLSAIRTKLTGHSIRLFVKERRLAFYTAKYKRYPHVDVRVTSADFVDQLAAYALNPRPSTHPLPGSPRTHARRGHTRPRLLNRCHSCSSCASSAVGAPRSRVSTAHRPSPPLLTTPLRRRHACRRAAGSSLACWRVGISCWCVSLWVRCRSRGLIASPSRGVVTQVS